LFRARRSFASAPPIGVLDWVLGIGRYAYMSAEIFGPDIFIVLLNPLVGIFLFGIVAIVAAVIWFASGL
jgi:hypothetical protein